MKQPIHPMQAMVNGMNAAWQRERAQSQMTLGSLIKALEALEPTRLIEMLHDPHSYRGYYSDLAFEPGGGTRTVGELLADCRECMGKVFEGYKGGDFQMGASTPIFVAMYSRTGPRLMGIEADADTDPIRIITAEEDDDDS